MSRWAASLLERLCSPQPAFSQGQASQRAIPTSATTVEVNVICRAVKGSWPWLQHLQGGNANERGQPMVAKTRSGQTQGGQVSLCRAPFLALLTSQSPA
jgi:hypothetical protein